MKFDLTQPWTGHVPLNTVIPNPDQPRRTFDLESMDRLVRSLRRNRQQVPCTVIPFTDPKLPNVKWLLVDGERRHRACGAAGLLQIWITYKPDLVSDNHQGNSLHSASFMANWCREGHTKAETMAAVVRERKTRSLGEIADSIGKDQNWVWRYEQLGKLHPDLLALMDPPTPKEKRLPMVTALALVQYPLDQQLQGWDYVKKHRPSEQVHAVRHLEAPQQSVGTAAISRPAGAPTLTRPQRPTLTERRPHHNRQYVTGRVTAITRTADLFLGIPTSILSTLEPAVLSEIALNLRNLEAKISQGLTRINSIRPTPEAAPAAA